jgi:hypothetical protein
MYRTYRLLFLVVMFLHTSSVTASPVIPEESRLAVYTHGFKVGEIISRYTRQDEGGHVVVSFTSHTRINADFLVTTYSLEGDEEARIGPEGTLSYRKAWQENGARHLVDGRLEGGTFHCVSTGPNSEVRAITVPRERYDFTTMDCPELRLKREGESLTVRLLDLETCEVVTRHYHWVRTERLTFNGVADLFRVIDFQDRNKSGTRWILPATVGVKIARQDGTSRKGAYSARAIDVAR